MYCPMCGAKANGLTFCEKCGQRLKPSPEQPRTVAPAPWEPLSREPDTPQQRSVNPRLIAMVLIACGALVAVAAIGLSIARGGHGQTAEVAQTAQHRNQAAASTAAEPSPLPSAATPTSTSTRVPDTEATLRRVSGLISESSATRSVVAPTVQRLTGCSIGAATAASLLDSATTQRNALLSKLAGLDLSGVADARRVRIALTQAWAYSRDADQAFAAWARQMADSGGCYAGNTDEPHYQAGMRYSAQAIIAKRRFARMWNAVAGEHGLPRTSENTL